MGIHMVENIINNTRYTTFYTGKEILPDNFFRPSLMHRASHLKVI
jgi:hypothetical protein